MPTLNVKVALRSSWSEEDFRRIKMLLNFRGLGGNVF
jgi:hypothetical protein